MKRRRKVVLLIAILVFTPVSQADLLPEPFNLTSYRIKYDPVCQEARCIVDWIQDENATQTGHDIFSSNCSEFGSYAQMMISLFSTGKVQREFIEVWYERSILMYCSNTCSIRNVLKMCWVNLDVQIEGARSFADDEFVRKVCPWPLDYCKWWSYSMRFKIFFAFFAFPATLILNLINMSTMTKLISAHKTPAASLYFHKAEIYTDVCCSVVFYFWNNLGVFPSFDMSLSMCLPALVSYISVYELSSPVVNLLMFINQCTLYNLVSDRCSPLKDPLSYDAFNGRAIARKRQAKTVCISCILFAPLILIHIFGPLFEFWRKQINYLYHSATVLTALYALAPVVCVVAQIVKGVQYQKLYEAQLKSSTIVGAETVQERNQIKKNEQDKRLLLIGTVGLNVAAGIVSMLLSFFESNFAWSIFGAVWWLNVLYVLSSLCVFMNGTGSFIIHVILLKSYRAAFWETVFGKAISKMANKLFHIHHVVADG